MTKTRNIIPALSVADFVATRTGLVVKGKPSFEAWEAYGAGLREVDTALQWVIGDWLNYGDQAYGETYTQALRLWPEAEYQTLRSYKYVASRVDCFPRETISWSHCREVAALPPAEQRRWLSLAKKKKWPCEKLRREIKVERYHKSNDPVVPLDTTDTASKFGLVYADPPWVYEHTASDNRAIENHYPTMPLEEICALPIQQIAAENCVLFLWATSPKLAEALQVVSAWGFNYRTCAVWVKDKIGMGYYFRQRHELLLISTLGEPLTPEPENRPDSVITAPRTRHSEKPEIVYGLIERMYPRPAKIGTGGQPGATRLRMNHFQNDLAWSNLASHEPFWSAIYQKAFCNFARCVDVTQSAEHQRMGIDKLIYLSNGMILKVDEKKRRNDYPDILLEYISVSTQNKPGWIEKDLAIDYLAYGFLASRRCYLFPFPMLRRAWIQFGKSWIAEHRRIESFNNNGYTTIGVAVPIEILRAAVSTAAVIYLQPTANSRKGTR